MAVVVRRAESDADLEAWREVRIAVLPHERTQSVEELRQHSTPERLFLVGELGGDVVGSGFAARSDDGESIFVAPRVLPDARRRGVGRALLRALVEHAERFAPPRLVGFFDDRDSGSWAFAVRFGFEEVDRQVEQVRRLADAEPAPEFPPGVEVVSVAERPDVLEAAYELAVQGYADMATPRPVSITREAWLAEEATLPGGSFAALAGGEVVGFSGLMRDPDDPERAEDGLTVVRRDWRRRGLAIALKRAELAWAAANGVREIYTWTQRGNEAMRRVNEELGYEYRHIAISVAAPLARVRRAL